jgi:hypothetical protein
MQCNKCKTNVPSEFEYVLNKNVCPKCGNKLMADAAMRVYMDLKKRLDEVEFVMDKVIVCERIAMFMITNYEVIPLNATSSAAKTIKTAHEAVADNKLAVETFKAQLASLDEDPDLSPEEIRAQEAARAEDIATAREMGMDVDDLDENEELVTGAVDADRIQRLKKLAISGKAGVMVKRVGP